MGKDTDRCAYEVTDANDDPQPCDRPATGWRWYQGHAHEDMLDAACEFHENEGGRRIHEAEAEVKRLGRILSNLDCEGEGYECLTHQSPWVSWDSPIGECEWARDHSEVPGK